MTDEMKKDLERFGRIEKDYKTWIHPWKPYYTLYCKRHHSLLVKTLSRKYPKYSFCVGEAHICNTIYRVINIGRKEE